MGTGVWTRYASQYDDSDEAIVEYKEFPGRSHFTLGQPGWESRRRPVRRRGLLDIS
jgi:hypothetical protein